MGEKKKEGPGAKQGEVLLLWGEKKTSEGHIGRQGAYRRGGGQ